MSKFNQTSKATPNSTNMAGGVSYTRPIKKELTTVILNSLLNSNSYYEKESDRLDRIEKLILSASHDFEFVAKCAIYTRNEGKLRSVSHFISVILLENVKGQPVLKKALEKVMVRVDDATEIVSLFMKRNPGKMIPNALRRAIKHNLENSWDLYQLKKYAQPKAKVKVKDLVKLTHPDPKVWNSNFGKAFV